jgi:hypothetical protein
MHGKGTAAAHFRAGNAGASTRPFHKRAATDQPKGGPFGQIPNVRTLGSFGAEHLQQGGVCAARSFGFAQGFFQHARNPRLKNTFG